MTRKWGNSSIASGELTLVPYSDQTSDLSNSQKWTCDSVLSAADVYAAIGSPSVFRLRFFFLLILFWVLFIRKPLEHQHSKMIFFIKYTRGRYKFFGLMSNDWRQNHHV